jgi:hypothetical protein
MIPSAVRRGTIVVIVRVALPDHDRHILCEKFSILFVRLFYVSSSYPS